MSDDSAEGFDFNTDTSSIQVTYRKIPFEVKALHSPQRDVWTAYITSEAIQTSIFPNPPTYATRDQALASLVQIAVAGLDTVLDQAEALLRQLGNGQPVPLQEDDPISSLLNDMVQEMFASPDIDQTSEFMQQFRRAFEQSQQ